MGSGNEGYPLSKFRMKITYLEKNGENLRVVDSKWVKGNGKKFRKDLDNERAGGIVRTIEIVDEKPEKFKLNQIYMLRTRDVVWVFTEKEAN